MLPDSMFKTRPMPDLTKLGNEFSGIALGLRRDKHGIALEGFGPTGSLLGILPALLWTGGERMVVLAPVPVR